MQSGSYEVIARPASTTAPEFGTNFTVLLRQIELTAAEREAISSDIIDVIIARIGTPTPPAVLELIEELWRGYSTGSTPLPYRRFIR
jgi:hypothetical protein